MNPMFFAILANAMCSDESPDQSRQEFRLVAEAGQITGVELNGQPYPVEQFRIAGGQLQILDAHGAVVCAIGHRE